MLLVKSTQTAEESTSEEEISPCSDDESSREEEGTPCSDESATEEEGTCFDDESTSEEEGTPYNDDESTRKEEGAPCSDESATEEEGTCSDDESTGEEERTPYYDDESTRKKEGTPCSDELATEEEGTCSDDESTRKEEGTPYNDDESTRKEEGTPCSDKSAREEKGKLCYDDESTREEERKPRSGCGEIKLSAGIVVKEENKNIYNNQDDDGSAREEIKTLLTDAIRLTDKKEVKSREKDSVKIVADRTKRKASIRTTINKEESSSEADGHGKRMFDEFKPWTKEELLTLISRMKEQLPSANMSCINVLKKYDWQEVAFDYYSAEDCKRKIRHLMDKIGTVKKMTEILSELEEKLTKGQISDGLIFEDRQIFAKSFIKENNERIIPSKIFETCAEAWKKTPKKEKYKYIEEAIAARRNVVIPECEKKRQVKTPFEIYYNYHSKIMDQRNLKFRKELMEKYKTLSVKEKYPYIYRSAVDLYNTVQEAGVCDMGHFHWNDSVRGGPSKNESEILLRFIDMPCLPPVSAPNLYYEENLKKGKYNDVNGPNKLFKAIEEFRELPDHIKMTYRKKRIQMVAAYTKEFSSWWQSQNDVMHTLAEKFLGKRLVLSESEKKNSVTENLPVKEVMPVDVSLPLEKETLFTGKKKVSGDVENEAPVSKEEKSSASVEKMVSADAEKKVPVCKEELSSAVVKEKVSANAQKNVPVCKEKQSSVIVKKNVSVDAEKKVSVSKKKHSSSSAPDFLKPMLHKLSDINPALSLRSKIKRLKDWKDSYKRLEHEDREVCKKYFKRLDIHISTMIFTDVANLKKMKREKFLGRHRLFLRGIFKRDIFQECYPINKYPEVEYVFFRK